MSFDAVRIEVDDESDEECVASLGRDAFIITNTNVECVIPRKAWW